MSILRDHYGQFRWKITVTAVLIGGTAQEFEVLQSNPTNIAAILLTSKRGFENIAAHYLRSGPGREASRLRG